MVRVAAALDSATVATLPKGTRVEVDESKGEVDVEGLPRVFVTEPCRGWATKRLLKARAGQSDAARGRPAARAEDQPRGASAAASLWSFSTLAIATRRSLGARR